MRKLVIPAALAVTVLAGAACEDEEPECQETCRPRVSAPVDAGVCPEEPDYDKYPQTEGCPPECERTYCFS
jgi:hypothetical protein